MKFSDFIFPYPAGLGAQNDGPSVTNAAERVVEALLQHGYVTGECEFIEHYERSGRIRAVFNDLSISEGQARWKKLRMEDVLERLACSKEELTRATLRDPRLAREIGRLRQSLFPRSDLPDPDPTEVIQRRLTIEKSTITRAR